MSLLTMWFLILVLTAFWRHLPPPSAQRRRSTHRPPQPPPPAWVVMAALLVLLLGYLLLLDAVAKTLHLLRLLVATPLVL